jgi:plastocyanin
MPDWSVKIDGKPATFTPDIDGAATGTPLKVVQGDLVSWNNMTQEQHWPAPDDTAANGSFMANAINPDSSSTAYNLIAPAGTTISYHCMLHPDERGKLVVVNFGDN